MDTTINGNTWHAGQALNDKRKNPFDEMAQDKFSTDHHDASLIVSHRSVTTQPLWIVKGYEVKCSDRRGADHMPEEFFAEHNTNIIYHEIHNEQYTNSTTNSIRKHDRVAFRSKKHRNDGDRDEDVTKATEPTEDSRFWAISADRSVYIFALPIFSLQISWSAALVGIIRPHSLTQGDTCHRNDFLVYGLYHVIYLLLYREQFPRLL